MPIIIIMILIRKYCSIMNIKSSICGIQHTCTNFLIFLIITKIECWPVFKQEPNLHNMFLQCSQYFLSMFLRCSQYDPSMLPICSFNVPNIFFFNVPSMFPICSFDVPNMFLNFHNKFFQCSQYIPWMFHYFSL